MLITRSASTRRASTSPISRPRRGRAAAVTVLTAGVLVVSVLSPAVAAPTSARPASGSPAAGACQTSYPLPHGTGLAGLALDSHGNVYSTNTTSGTVSKLTPSGQLIDPWATIAPVGTTAPAPGGIAIDASGDVYVANNGTSTITKLSGGTSGAVVTTYALPADSDPEGLAVDASGNVYATTTQNVLKVAPDGTVTTYLVGTTFLGLMLPWSITVDTSGTSTNGTVYVVNWAMPSQLTVSSNSISRLTPAGVWDPQWALLLPDMMPEGITVDSHGNVFVVSEPGAGSAYQANGGVDKVTPAGAVTLNWGNLGNLSEVEGLTIDESDNLYTVDVDKNTVMEVTPAAAVTTVWAQFASGTWPSSPLADPAGDVYVAEPNANAIVRVQSHDVPTVVTGISPTSGTAFGGTPITITGTGFAGATAVSFGATPAAAYTVNAAGTRVTATSPASSTGAVNVSVTNACGTSPVTAAATYTFYVIPPGIPGGQLVTTYPLAPGAAPFGITKDPADNIYTANSGTNTVSRLSPTGVLTDPWATIVLGVDAVMPTGIATDASGNVYVANYYGSTVALVTPGGTVSSWWASLNANASPQGVAVGPSGVVYTANKNGTISRITPQPSPAVPLVTEKWGVLSGADFTGVVVDGAGNVYASSTTLSDSTNSLSAFSAATGAVLWTLPVGKQPAAVALDADGNVYVVSSQGGTLSQLSAFGSANWTRPVGPGPYGVAVDAAGNVYTANFALDGTNNTVSKVTSAGVVTAAWATLDAGAGPRAVVVSSKGIAYTANYTESAISRILPAVAPTAVAGDGQVSVTVVAPRAGDPPMSYAVTAVQDPTKTCTVTGPTGTCVVTGLTDETAYAFTTTASNAGGTSAVSLASNVVTPSPDAVTAPRITARIVGTRNAAGWFAARPSIVFTCTPGSARLTTVCPGPIVVGEGRGQSLSRTILAADGGHAAVHLTGLNIDLTRPSVAVHGVRAGHAFAGSPLGRFSCVASDRLAGPASCSVSVRRIIAPSAPRYVASWRFTAIGRDRAGHSTAVTGTYTTGSFGLSGLAAGRDGTIRVTPGSRYPLQARIGGRTAPRLYYARPAGHDRAAMPYQRGPLLRGDTTGVWSQTVTIPALGSITSRYWNIGIRTPDGRLHVLTLDLGPRA